MTDQQQAGASVTAAGTETETGTRTGTVSGVRIRWGRTIIFGIAALAFLIFLGTAIAALFGANSLLASGISLLISIAGIVGLRLLARRDAYRRATKRRGESVRVAEPVAEPVKAETEAEAEPAAEVKQAEKSVKAAQPKKTERTERVFDLQSSSAADNTVSDADTETAEPTEPAEVTETAEPVEPAKPAVAKNDETVVKPAPKVVPRPKYLDAEEVQRAEPEPLVVEETPKPAPDTQLKDGVSPEYAAKISAKANRRLDLDQVLNRRRAI